ncbi:VWA domain-containing protein [Ramlibacter sp. 2FC]|uniref:vWA domain-containing protein n=1 Tax=Ramlibacter sp. 2FC TaxID=2502188 RepID=UPI001485B90E|nr:VWA domain-containing protein [Ramlibacter sp. 2FC]
MRSENDLFGRLVGAFGNRLHAAGVPVDPDRSARFADAIGLAEPKTVEQLYWIGRVTLLTARDQVPAYDAVFQQCFMDASPYAQALKDERRPDEGTPGMPEESVNDGGAEYESGDATSGSSLPDQLALADDASDLARTAAGEPAGELSGESKRAGAVLRMSAEERLAVKDFAACTPEELATLASAIERLRLMPPPRRTSRMRSGRKGRNVDVRATIRRSCRTAGEPMVLVRQERVLRPRRVVLIADVSGSMESFARLYLHLMRGAVQALHAEAFVFATRLTRLTKVLGTHHPNAAYRRALDSAPDWSGGTRIGQALADFVDQHGRRGVARGAVIVIVSDGWETQNVGLVESSMRELSRLAHHIVWINPRMAADGYRPLVGGMAAALPWVNTFVPGHTYRALEEVVAAISAATPRMGSRGALPDHSTTALRRHMTADHFSSRTPAGRGEDMPIHPSTMQRRRS